MEHFAINRFVRTTIPHIVISFSYAFSVNYSIDLRVEIAGTVWLASTSVSDPGKDDHLDLAKIPIDIKITDITNNFYITFEASRRVSVPQKGRSVYMDDVMLVQSPCSLSPPSASPDFKCHPTGPLNCSFQDSTFCGWSRGYWNFVNIDSNLAIQLTTTTETSKLQSQNSCATQTACLSFCYGFKVNYAIGLYVKVQEKSMSPKTLWFKSELESPIRENKWDVAFISFSTSDDYVVYFETQRIDKDVPAQEGLVYIDDIQFVPFSCDVYHTTQTTQLPTTEMNTTPALLSTLALNEEESSDTISVTTTTASFPTPMTHTTQAPHSTLSAPKEEESSAIIIALIVTIALDPCPDWRERRAGHVLSPATEKDQRVHRYTPSTRTGAPPTSRWCG
jgi:hypothetical protein